KAQLDDAVLTRERTEKLSQQDLVARAQLDTAVAAEQVAEARYHDALEEARNRQAILAQRRSEPDMARQALTDTVLLAPADGLVREGGDRHGDGAAGRVGPDVVHRGVRRHRESVERQGRALPGEARDDRPEGEGSGRDRRGHHGGRAGDRRARQPRRRAARGDRQSVTAGTMNVAGRRSRSSPILTYNGVRGGRLLARALSGSFLVPARAR